MRKIWDAVKMGFALIGIVAASLVQFIHDHPAEDKLFIGAGVMELVWAVIVAKTWGFGALMLLLSAYICPFVWVALLWWMDHRDAKSSLNP